MENSELAAKRDQLFDELFDTWSAHPMTGQLINKIKEHRERMIQEGISRVSDFELGDTYFRNVFYGVKSVDSVIKLMTNKQIAKQ